MAPEGITIGDDGVARCSWADSAPEYRAYHDTEWGFPVADDVRLFEKLSLEGFQAGLSWLTILRKREAFRAAFAGFDFDQGGAVRGRRRRQAARMTPASCATGARSRRSSTTPSGRSSWSPPRAHWRITSGASSRAQRHGGLDRAALGRAGDDRGLQGAGQGPQAPRLAVRGPHHRVRVHAGHGSGQRPPRRLPRPGPAPPRRVAPSPVHDPGAAAWRRAAGHRRTVGHGRAAGHRPAAQPRRRERPRIGGRPLRHRGRAHERQPRAAAHAAARRRVRLPDRERRARHQRQRRGALPAGQRVRRRHDRHVGVAHRAPDVGGRRARR